VDSKLASERESRGVRITGLVNAFSSWATVKINGLEKRQQITLKLIR
jgi:hypothetical protein